MQHKSIQVIVLLVLTLLVMIGLPYAYYNHALAWYNTQEVSKLPDRIIELNQANNKYINGLLDQYKVLPSEIIYEVYDDVKPGWYIPKDREQLTRTIKPTELLTPEYFLRIPAYPGETLQETDFENGVAYIGNYMIFKVLEDNKENDRVYPVAYYRLCPKTGTRYFSYDGYTITELRCNNRYDVRTGQGITTDKSLIRVNIELKIRKTHGKLE